MRLVRRYSPLLVLVLAFAAAGCAASPAMDAAREHDLPRLARELDAAKKSGELEDGDVRDVAEALAETEIERAKGDAGEKVIDAYAPCAAELEGALSDRSEQDDDVAAAAAMVLLGAGLVDDDEYEDYAIDHDERPAFRALGARSLLNEKWFALRRELFLDLDERVRAAALKAATDAPTANDLTDLVEAARLDPNPAARAAAVRAIGHIGGVRATLALKDLWTLADGRLRQSIVVGYMSPSTFDAGGRDQLVRAVESGGEGGLAAATLLARAVASDPQTRAARDVAIAFLERTITSGTRDERALAILMAPSSARVMEATRAAQDDSDPGIAAVALGRMAREGDAAERKASLDKLLKLAQGDEPEADRALGELAALGDARATPLLEKRAAAKSSYARSYAARGLVSLGEISRVAGLLADAEDHVRADVACAVLRAP